MSALKECCLLYGPPGSGKSTLAKEIVKFFPETVYLSVGDITREEISSRTPEGLLLKKYLDEFTQYPLDLITDLVWRNVASAKTNNKGIVLDGYPKYPNEAESFIEVTQRYGIEVGAIIILEAPLGVMQERAAKRRICTGCSTQVTVRPDEVCLCGKCGSLLVKRDDDTYSAIERRYGDYRESINSTLRLLRRCTDNIAFIDGCGKVSDVACNAVNILLRSSSNARVAQQRERLLSLQEVVGSSPASGSQKYG